MRENIKGLVTINLRLSGRAVVIVGDGDTVTDYRRILKRAGAIIVQEGAKATFAIVEDDLAAVSRLKVRGTLVHVVGRPDLSDFMLSDAADAQDTAQAERPARPAPTRRFAAIRAAVSRGAAKSGDGVPPAIASAPAQPADALAPGQPVLSVGFEPPQPEPSRLVEPVPHLEPELTAALEPEPTPEVSIEPEAVPEPEPEPGPDPQLQPAAELVSAPKAAPHRKAASGGHSTAEPEPALKPEPQSDPKPSLDLSSRAEPLAEAEPAPAAELASPAEPDSQVQPVLQSEATSAPPLIPEPEPDPRPSQEAAPVCPTDVESAQPTPSVKPMPTPAEDLTSPPVPEMPDLTSGIGPARSGPARAWDALRALKDRPMPGDAVLRPLAPIISQFIAPVQIVRDAVRMRADKAKERSLALDSALFAVEPSAAPDSPIEAFQLDGRDPAKPDNAV